MKTLEEQLTNYARYHRSRRNILTHFVGIPAIVFAALCLLARTEFSVGAVALNGAHIAVAVCVTYYLRLSGSLGMVMAVILSAMTFAAMPVAALSSAGWLGISLSLFFVGWVFQFVGHYFEGRKPAFVDDLVGLIIGPLFVLVEALFRFGYYKSLADYIDQHAGPVQP